MLSEDGTTQKHKDDIAEVFACFYEDLYKSTCSGRSEQTYDSSDSGSIEPFTLDELTQALKTMRSGRARDASGIVAEMLKLECPGLHEIILELFNDILQPGVQPPSD